MSETSSNGPDTQPEPDGGWSEEILTLRNALVLPPVESGFVQAAGVLDSSGTYCPHGALWRKYRPLTTTPQIPETPAAPLTGRWLWGGVLWAHFGHFLVESTSRLWALDHLETAIDGVLFIPKRPRVGDALRSFQTDFVSMMAPGLAVRVASEPTRVEELIVPGQGFGLGRITAGTQKFRDAVHNQFARDIMPEGPERIYISRSALGLDKGGLLGEERLEKLLAQEGYETFHPEKHSLATQIARYKAAKQVIAADGSALHLFAMVGRPDQNVAIILRRQSSANNLLAANVTHFCGREPLVIHALRGEWARAVGKTKSNRLSFGELDHTAIGRALAQGGFVSDQANWPPLGEDERQAILVEKGMGKSGEFVELPGYARKRIREARRRKRAVEAANPSKPRARESGP